MTFSELVAKVAKETCWPKTKVERVLRAGFRQMQQGLRHDGEVSINGFGRFALKDMPDRDARDFQTGETIRAAGKRKVRFYSFRRTDRLAQSARSR